MSFSLVDSYVYHRRNGTQITYTADWHYFQSLRENCTVEQYNELWSIYCRPGDQTEALRAYADQHNINVASGINTKDSE